MRPKPEKLLPPFDIPAPLQRVVSLPSGKVALYEWGNPVSQPTVLLLHGWNGWAMQFANFIPPLLAQGMAVVAIDHIAHGNSAGRRASLPVFIDSTRELLEHLPHVSGIVAHSLGAAAAAYVLAQTQERSVPLVLLAPPKGPRVFIEQFAAALGMPVALVDRTQQWIEQTYRLTFDAVSAERVAPRLLAPTRIMHDAADEVVPLAHGKSYAQLAPHARLEQVSGVGHYRILRAPEVIRMTVEFLSDRLHDGSVPKSASV